MHPCWSLPWLFLTNGLPSILASPLLSPKSTARWTEEQDGVTFNVFQHGPTDSKLRYVNDSGICETTPGVHQHSGYATVGEDMHMWFWHFEARHNPETAPLVIILAGGPGGATADHIFGHDGPCKFRNGKTTLNPYSFNEYANLLYIDQPIAAGFSQGRNPIDSTDSATKYVYRFLQAFLAGFKQFQGRDTGIFTASYGGHTGPSLGYEILLANNLIRAGDFDGIHVNLTSVCLQNAMMDAGIQMRADVEYAFTNNHRQMINQTIYHHLLDTFDSDIEPVIERCHAGVDDQACVNATELYGPKIESAISESLEEIDPLSDVYDIRKSQDYPSLIAKYWKPDALIKYLSQPEVIKAIGA